MAKQIAHIQLVLKAHIRDVEGQKVAESAGKYLGIDTGRIKSSKIFSVCYDLAEREVQEFANLCLKDGVVNEVWIHTFFHDAMYQSYIVVAKLPGVTDDEGTSAQKTLADFLNISLDTHTQHIFSKEAYLIEKALEDKQLQKIAEELLGNKLIHHFEYGFFSPSQQGRGTPKYPPPLLGNTVD